MERVVKLKNMVNKTVGVKISEYNVNKKWTRKGQEIPLPYETVSQLLWHDGFRKMIDRGILYIEDMQDKIDLGLEPDTAKTPENIIVLNEGQMRTLLKVKTFDEFKETVKKLTLTQIRNLVNFAIENELIGDIEKCEYLEELSQSNILKTVYDNRKLAKLDKGE